MCRCHYQLYKHRKDDKGDLKKNLVQIGQNWWCEVLFGDHDSPNVKKNDFRSPETIKEIEFIIVPLEQITEARCFHWWLQQRFRKSLEGILHNLRQKTAEGETSQFILWSYKTRGNKKKSHTTISLINRDVKLLSKILAIIIQQYTKDIIAHNTLAVF